MEKPVDRETAWEHKAGRKAEITDTENISLEVGTEKPREWLRFPGGKCEGVCREKPWAPTPKGWQKEKPWRERDIWRQREGLEKWNLGTERRF